MSKSYPHFFYTVQCSQDGFPVRYLHPVDGLLGFLGPFGDPGEASQEFLACVVGPQNDASYLEEAAFEAKVRESKQGPTVEQVQALLPAGQVVFALHKTFDDALFQILEIMRREVRAEYRYFERLGSHPWLVSVPAGTDIDDLISLLYPELVTIGPAVEVEGE